MDEAPTKKTRCKVILERGEEGYVAYPLRMKGVIVGQGDSIDAALSDLASAIRAHVEQFGPETLLDDEST